MTHGLVYIRAGSHTLAGSTHAAPAKLPASGALRWHGVDYEVSSFRAPSAGTRRVYCSSLTSAVVLPHSTPPARAERESP